MFLLLLPTLLIHSIVGANVIRIIGGRDADIAQHPWQVSLFLPDGTFYCSGSIIYPNWILTAAHCNLNANYTTVRAGSNRTDQGGQVADVLNIVQHPHFNIPAGVHDIALVKLSSPLEGFNIDFVTLPGRSEPVVDGSLVNVAGWGLESLTDPNQSNRFKEIMIPVVSSVQCNDLYWDNYKNVTNYQFCAGYVGVGGQGPCSGDSGGPAVIDGVAVGIVSWSRDCAQPEYPAVFTRVSEYIDWIHSIVGGEGVE